MTNQNKKIENLSKVNGRYRIKVDNMYVDMIYTENGKSFGECMLNILKQKAKRDWYYKQYKKKRGIKFVAGRKSKYSSIQNSVVKQKIWSAALYIRLSQEDEEKRKRKTRKQ